MLICYNVASLQLASCCPAPFLGDPAFIDHVVYMFLVLYRPLCSTSGCCVLQLFACSGACQIGFSPVGLLVWGTSVSFSSGYCPIAPCF